MLKINKEKIKMKLRKVKKRSLISVGIILVILFSFTAFVFVINKQHRKMSVYRDVTFINPRQAIIFWKTDRDTLGHVRYGVRRYSRKNIELQTNSEPGEVHVVFLEDIPLDGIYVSIHNDSDTFLLFPEIFKIQFNEENLIDE
jgi:hypothetical protein